MIQKYPLSSLTVLLKALSSSVSASLPQSSIAKGPPSPSAGPQSVVDSYFAWMLRQRLRRQRTDAADGESSEIVQCLDRSHMAVSETTDMESATGEAHS